MFTYGKSTLLIFSLCAVSALGQTRGVRTIGAETSSILEQAGSYVMTSPIALDPATGAGITIRGNDIVLDMNGQSITGLSNQTGVGIRVMGGRNVVIKNGTINGMQMGVVVMNSANVRVEGLMIRGMAGAPPENGVMLVQTRNSVIRNNQIFNAALGIFVRGGMTFGNRIEDNTITAGTGGALGICYNPSDDDPRGPNGDLVARNMIFGYPISISIAPVSNFNVVQGNTLFFTTTGVRSTNTSNPVTNNTEVKM